MMVRCPQATEIFFVISVEGRIDERVDLFLDPCPSLTLDL